MSEFERDIGAVRGLPDWTVVSFRAGRTALPYGFVPVTSPL